LKKNSFILVVILTLSFAGFASQRHVFIASPEGTVYLPDSNIVVKSESLYCGKYLLDSTKYQLDYQFGKLDLALETTCDSLIIDYHYVRLDLQRYVQHRVTRGMSGQLLPPKTPRKYAGMIPEGSELKHSGSLLRGIKIGSRRDLSIESAFQLEAYGNIGENYQISAVLSDQDLPIQPEGTSENIAQLDQVFIGIEGPHFEANFGDFQVDFDQSGEFVNYQRRLSGVNASGFADIGGIEAVGAVLEGVWASDKFTGTEGLQGPYPLSADGKTSIQVLAGTENIWLDGKKLTRGESNDYIIDYNLGQITFTNDNPITSESRVVVDFQYTDNEFRRNFYGLGGELKPADDVRFFFSAITELDDKENPLNTEFTDSEIDILSEAGDMADSAYIWGAMLSDSGSYVMVDSATDSAHFEYVGEDMGEWEVSFTNIGTGNGEYDDAGSGIYEWVGEGAGSYTPRRMLDMPVSQGIFDIGLEYVPLEGVTLSTEMATSTFDLNRFSSVDDDDNTGEAYNIGIIAERPISIRESDLGDIRIRGNYRKKNANYYSIGRLDDAEYLRDWGMEEGSGKEELAEIGFGYNPLDIVSLDINYGSNQIGEQSSDRIGTSLNLNPGDWSNSFNFSRLSTDGTNAGDWDKYWISSGGPLWVFTPNLTGRYEDRKLEDGGGFEFWQSSASLNIAPIDWLSFTPGIEIRDNRQYSLGILEDDFRSRAYSLKGELDNWEFSVYHKEYEAQTEGESDVQSDLASIDGYANIPIPDAKLRMRYKLSRERNEILEPYYEYVGEGSGNYELDEDRGEYIAAVGGDYFKRYNPTGIFTPVISSDLKLNFDWKGSQLKGENSVADLIRLISVRTMAQTEGQTEETGYQSLLFDPRDMINDDLLITGRFLGEGSVRVGRGASKYLLFRRRYDKFRSVQYTSGEEFRWSDSKTFEGRYSLGKTGNWKGKLELKQQVRLYPGSSRIGNDIEGSELSLFWTRSVGTDIQLSAETGYLSEKDNWPDDPVKTYRYSGNVGGTYHIKGGTIRWMIEYARVEAEDDYRGVLPVQMAKGDYIGDNGRLTLVGNITVARGTVLTISYNLVSHTSLPPEHSGEAKIRLLF